MLPGFDHIVLASRDLAAQAAFYRAMGFQVGGLNQHPWGTQNQVIQLHGSFLELIGVARGAVMPPVFPAPQQFSFGGFVGDYLDQHQGLAMLALRSQDAVADALRFRAAGIGAFDPFQFGRTATLADGTPREVSFSLAFAHSALIQAAGFFTCQHHRPENFWAPAMQHHANGAQQLTGVVMVAENPADHAEFLSHFIGQREMLSTSMGVEIACGKGMVEVLTPLAAQFRYMLETQSHPHFCAYRISVADMAVLRASLAQSGIPAHQHGAFTIVPARAAFGAAFVFEPA